MRPLVRSLATRPAAAGAQPNARGAPIHGSFTFGSLSMASYAWGL